MPNFQYEARNDSGKLVRGSMTALDEQELHERLKKERLYLISAKEVVRRFRGRPIKSRELSDFNRQISQMVSGGVSLAQALFILTRQETLKPHEQEAYTELYRRVRQGVPLSQAMEELGNTFPPLLIHMYRSAEASGTLDQVSMRMSQHYDKEWRLNKKVSSSTMYPKILAFVTLVVVVVIMTFVLPKFESMFSQMETLPAMTAALMGISGFISRYWIVLLLALAALIVGVRALLKNPGVRLRYDKLVLRIPYIGKLSRTICTARFARTLSSLYSSGLPMVSALEIARRTIGNSYIDSQFDAVITDVRAGTHLSAALDHVDGFVKKLEFSIRVGEETGALDSMLESTADALDYESEMALSQMVGILEPALIFVMAGIVGFIMVAVIVPIYGSYQTIGKVY